MAVVFIKTDMIRDTAVILRIYYSISNSWDSVPQRNPAANQAIVKKNVDATQLVLLLRPCPGARHVLPQLQNIQPIHSQNY